MTPSPIVESVMRTQERMRQPVADARAALERDARVDDRPAADRDAVIDEGG